ncbi:MAG: protein kinase, partial [Limisphaerales bacterium]
QNLAELVREHPWPAQRAARCVQTIAKAIHYAHQQGILHRDLKPSNVIIDSAGEPHVTDFGLAKRLDAVSNLTLAGMVLGTPSYMAPEQASGRRSEIGPTADVYSLGAILYELLTGRPPFQAESTMATLQLVCEREPVSPRRLNPRVSRDLEVISLKCLEKEPHRRYATAGGLADDLDRHLRGQPIQARPLWLLQRVSKWTRRKPAVAGLSLTTAAAIIVGMIGIVREGKRAALHQRQAEDIVTRLWNATPTQVRANRTAPEPAWRTKSMDALRVAATVRPSLSLRNEAIATLAMMDWDLALPYRQTPSVPLQSITLDPAHTRYAVGSTNGVAVIYSLPDGRELLSLECGGPWVYGLVFSRKGRFLALRVWDSIESLPDSPFRVMVWDTQSHSICLRTDPATFTAYDFTPDEGRFAIGLTGGGIRQFLLPEGREVDTLPTEHTPTFLRYSPDGRHLVSSDSDTGFVVVWDRSDSTVLGSRRLDTRVFSLTWDSSSEWTAIGGEDGSVHCWQIRTDDIRTFSGHQGLVHHVEFSPRGDLLVSNGYDGTSRLWHWPSGRLMAETSHGYARQFSDDGHRIGWFRTRQGFGTWRFAPSQALYTLTLPTRDQETSGVPSVDISEDARLIAVASGNGVQICDAVSGRLITFVLAPGARAVRFHPDSRQLLIGDDEGLSVLSSLQEIREGGSPSESVGRALTAGMENPRLVRHPFPKLRLVHWLDVTADGRIVAASGRERLALIELNPTPRVLWSKDIATLGFPLALRPDGRQMVWWGVYTVTLDSNFHAAVAGKLDSIRAGGDFTPDGRWFAQARYNAVQFLEADTWKPGLRLLRDSASDRPGVVAFSQDGSLCAYASDLRTVTLVDPHTGEALADLDAPDPQMILQLTLSADASFLAAVTTGDSVQVWNLRELRQELAMLGLDW